MTQTIMDCEPTRADRSKTSLYEYGLMLRNSELEDADIRVLLLYRRGSVPEPEALDIARAVLAEPRQDKQAHLGYFSFNTDHWFASRKLRYMPALYRAYYAALRVESWPHGGVVAEGELAQLVGAAEVNTETLSGLYTAVELDVRPYLVFDVVTEAFEGALRQWFRKRDGGRNSRGGKQAVQ